MYTKCLVPMNVACSLVSLRILGKGHWCVQVAGLPSHLYLFLSPLPFPPLYSAVRRSFFRGFLFYSVILLCDFFSQP